jgi:hypothetical protein
MVLSVASDFDLVLSELILDELLDEVCTLLKSLVPGDGNDRNVDHKGDHEGDDDGLKVSLDCVHAY